MESNTDDSPTVAAARLQSLDDIRGAVQDRGPSRALAQLQLWGAVVLGVYVGVFLFSFGAPAVDQVASVGGGYVYTSILLFPVLLFSGLSGGARERFGIRRKASRGTGIAYVLFLAAFMALLVLTIAGIPYPWFANLIVAALLFATLAAVPIRQLSKRVGVSLGERWVNEPLSIPVRWCTALIGAAAALVVGASTLQIFPVISVVVMLSLVLALIGWRASWGLPRAGYEWGPIHWSAFGVTMTVLFVMVLLLTRTTWITTPVAVTAGVFVLAIMLIAALLPRARNR